MKLYACFDTFTKFGRRSWILMHAFRERTDAERFHKINPGCVLKVFEEVKECTSQS